SVTSPGTLKSEGASSSVICIVWLACMLFPQLSIAVQILTMRRSIQAVPKVSSSKTICTFGSQLSRAVTWAIGGISSQRTVVSAGIFDKMGSVVSTTKTFWVKAVVLPQESVAVQVFSNK